MNSWRYSGADNYGVSMVTTTNHDATDEGTVTVHGSAAGFAQHISIGQHQLAADEPIVVGGTNIGPTPYDLLLSALGACKSMTVAMYARRNVGAAMRDFMFIAALK